MRSTDEITRRFFELQRWENALDTGVAKGISQGLLRELGKPDTRIALYRAIKERRYEISPPSTAMIPKDTRGEYRTVYINAPADRGVDWRR